MSAVGQLKQFVEGLLAPLRDRHDEQERAIRDLQERVAALEDRLSPATEAPARSVKAQAGTAQARAKTGPQPEKGRE